MNGSYPVDPSTTRTWTEVDLDAISHNLRLLAGQTAPGAETMAVVKADGYGHGALEVSRAALGAGASWLGVAMLDEALALRRAGVVAPILVLGYTAPSVAAEAVAGDVSLAVYRREALDVLDEAGRRLGQRARVHVKVDTGMGRIGLQPEEAVAFCREVAGRQWVTLEGVFTHFAAADSRDKAYTLRQFQRFTEVLEALEKGGIRVPFRHAANSAATIDLPETHLDLVRVGIALYGLQPSDELTHRLPLHPAMTWKTRVVHVKEAPRGAAISYGGTFETQRPSTIVTLPVGYADGYSRSWSNRGRVLLAGQRVPVVGRVCMDHTMVDATALMEAGLDIRVGDEAVLMGRQGEAFLSADGLAEGLGTISYEIVCLVGKRVPRVYLKGGRTVGVSSALP